MARPPPGGKAAQASQALAGLAPSGTGLPLPCSSDPSALCSGELDGPASRAHRPPRIPTLRCSRTYSLFSRPGVRGRPRRELEPGSRGKAGQVRAAAGRGDPGGGCACGCSAAHVSARSYL